jgi:hypothetical protein
MRRRRRRMKVVKTGTHRRYRFYTILNSLSNQYPFTFSNSESLYYVLWLSFHNSLYTYNSLDQYFATTPFFNRDYSLQVLLGL